MSGCRSRRRWGLASAVAGLCVLSVGGCFSGRSLSPLETRPLPESPVALLPVTPGQVRLVLKFPWSMDQRSVMVGKSMVASKDEFALSLNEILNTLAAGSGGRLLGPDELESRLRDAAVWEKVSVYLNDPGDIGEAWKTRGLSEVLGRCGVERFVRITAIVEADQVVPEAALALGGPGGGIAAFAEGWHGSIVVRAELFALSAPGSRAVGGGEAQFGGHAGFVIAFPVAYGKSVGLAADEAVRAALTELRRKHMQSGPPP